MFTTYEDIFEQRGRSYHDAMTRYPSARDEEFRHVLDMADVQPGDVVCDIPSGGGYLAQFVGRSVSVFHVETSRVFTDLCRDNGIPDALLGRFDAIPLNTASMDKAISLAALHHVEEKDRFFREAHRVLRENGTLVIADVRAGSAVSEFLDGFVGTHNSMGHRGYYIHPGTAAHIERCHFAVVESIAIPFRWHFESPEAMGLFCRLLFGIDRANTEQVIDGLRRHVGYSIDPEGCHLNWELLFIKASKR